MENASKKRSPNFTCGEETLLVSLAKKYKSILECKRSDTRTQKEKMDCWNTIENEFNAISDEIFRPKDVLKKKYDNIKKRVKKKYADEKCYLKGTGGGPPKQVTFTDIDNEVKEMLGTRVEGFQSQFDGDAEADLPNEVNAEDYAELSFQENANLPNEVNADDHAELSFQENADLPNEVNAEDHAELSFQENAALYSTETARSSSEVGNDMQDWSKYNPKMLRTKKSASIVPKYGENKTKKNEITTKVSQWASAKADMEMYKKTCLQKENNFKLEAMAEKHKKELELLEKEAKHKMDLQTAEQKFKLKLLLLDKYPNISDEHLESLFNRLYKLKQIQ